VTSRKEMRGAAKMGKEREYAREADTNIHSTHILTQAHTNTRAAVFATHHRTISSLHSLVRVLMWTRTLLTFSFTLSLFLSLSHAHTHTHIRTYTPTPTHTRTRTHTHTHTHIHTHMNKPEPFKCCISDVLIETVF